MRQRLRATILSLEYTGNGAIVAGEVYEMVLSVNGDTGFVNRTATSNVHVTISAANLAPSADAAQSNIVDEDDARADVLIKSGSAVGTVSASDNEALTYSIDAADQDFTVGNDGIIKAKQDIPDGETDNSAAKAEDEDLEYSLDSLTQAGWTYLDGETTSDKPDQDIMRDVTVTVSDGVESNDQEVEFTVTIDVNESVELVTEALPSDVAYDGTIDRDEDGEPTAVEADVEKEDSDTYSITVRAGDRQTPLTVIDLNVLVEDDDAGSLEFDEERDDGEAAHLVLEDDGELLLTYIPPDSDDEDGRTNWIEVTVTDEVNDGEGTDAKADQSFYIYVTVIEEITPIQSEFVGITVPENKTDCSLTDGGGTCSLAGVLDNADSYTIESGVHIVMDDAATADVDEGDFSIDDDGLITVNNAPDFEASLRPAFIVRVDDANSDLVGLISVRVTIVDENEPPVIDPIVGTPWVFEIAQDGEDVVTRLAGTVAPEDQDQPTKVSAEDPEGIDVVYSIITTDKNFPFAIDSASGALTVKLAMDQELDVETKDEYTFAVEASDGVNKPTMPVTIKILNSNESPNFISPAGDDAKTTIDEDRTFADGAIPFGGGSILVFTATDEDENDLTFELREGVSRDLFVINNVTKVSPGLFTGELRVKMAIAGERSLDYDDPNVYSKETGHRVHVEVQDGLGLSDTLLLEVKLNNVNDNAPAFNVAPDTTISVPENTARGVVLANYAASDADGNTVTYSLMGDDRKRFSISDSGDLMTLESLDADRGVPCGTDGCDVTIIATDGLHIAPASATDEDPPSVDITVTGIEDSVSTLDVTKANPVPGTESGHPMSALAGVKAGGDEYLWNLLDCPGMLELVGSTDEATYCKMWDGLSAAAKAKVSAALTSEAPPEAPYSLPASYGSAPVNFVETEWANWGTILRIEVTAEFPAMGCGSGSGNECVVIDVNSDSAGTSIQLEAYRSATQENKFVAALMLVELSEDATDSDSAVYAHSDGSVARIKVDEEDELEIEFGNLRGSIDIENEDPEISNYAPEHGALHSTMPTWTTPSR